MGKISAIMMVRDEVDIIHDTIIHLFEENIELIVVSDNNSVDGTRDVLSDLAKIHGNLLVLDDPEIAYYQSEKMTKLARRASELGAEWVLPVDADEIWYHHVDHLSFCLRRLPLDMMVVEVPLWNHFPSAIDQTEGGPFDQIVYRQAERGALPKTCFRYRDDVTVMQGNHSVTFNRGIEPNQTLRATEEGNNFGLRHFPYRSLEQFIRKAKNGAEAYSKTNLPPSVGAHWREYGAILERSGPEALQEVFETWFYFKAPVTAGLIYDPAPFLRWSRTNKINTE